MQMHNIYCRYRAVTSAYYRGALGAMVVYDITKRPTFDHVARWVEELRIHADSSLVITLIGNKADLIESRAVPINDAIEFAEEQGLFFSEASARSGENVENAFLRLLEEIYKVVSKKVLGSGGGVVVKEGLRIELVSGEDVSELEISEMRNVSGCVSSSC